MNVLPPILPPKALLRLPVSVRLVLARFTVWRLRQSGALKTSMLAMCLALLSGVLGFVMAQPPVLLDSHVPRLAAAQAQVRPHIATRDLFPSTRDWGELQAELMRLRLLFGRIADASDLDGAEFSLAVQLADDRFLESLSSLEDASRASAQRFVLAKRSVDHMTAQADAMLGITLQRQQKRRFTISGSPVVQARITSLYGYRTDPRSGKKQLHRGMDFGGKQGSKVLALADGVVTYSGKNGGYGNLVELEHANGYRTRYAHNEKNLVRVGTKVDKGQVIATMGSTGKSTGTHVHVEVRSNKRAVDPLQFVDSRS